MRFEPRSLDDYYAFGCHKTLTLNSSTHNIKIQYRVPANPPGKIKDARVIAIKVQDYKTSLSEIENSTVSTTWVDKVSLVHNFDDGDYLVIASADVTGDSTDDSVIVRLTLDGTQLGGEFSREPTIANEYYTFITHKLISPGSGSHTLKIQYKSKNGATVHIRNARITILKLEPYRYRYVESDTSSSHSYSWYKDKIAYTLPQNLAGEYLIMASALINHNDVNNGVKARLNIDGSTVSEMVYYPKDTSDWVSYFAIKKINFNSSKHTIKLQYAIHGASGKASIKNARLMILRLSPLFSGVGIVANSSQVSYSGDLYEINATVRFKSNVSANYRILIYNFNRSEWEFSNCDNGTVVANNWVYFKCSKNSNLRDYISKDNRIRIAFGTISASSGNYTFENGEIDSEWQMGGNADWYADNTEAHSGSWSMRAGAITDSQYSSISRMVQGPANITFWWKVSSEINYDLLRFYVDGVEKDRISGSIGWQKKEYTLSPGTHIIEWRYTKDHSTSSGSDTGWVDDISIDEQNIAIEQTQPLKTEIDFIQFNVISREGNYYFRKKFRVDNLDDILSARIRVYSDDRAEIYLNGNLIDNDTTEHNATYWNREIAVDPGLLNSGDNIIAVKLFNNDDESAKFDLEFGIEEKRKKFIVVMTDGIPTHHCGDCGGYPGCPGVCDDTSGTWVSDCYGTIKDCTGNNCSIAINDSICSSCNAHNELNATVYSIGIGPVTIGCPNANTTLREIAKCGKGGYCGSADPKEVENCYLNFAENIVNVTLIEQVFNISGNLSMDNIIYPDSYIRIYTTLAPYLLYGETLLTYESGRFGNNITNGSFFIPLNARPVNVRITSYSGPYWTDKLFIKNKTTGIWIDVYDLSDYGSKYELLGDPYIVNIPAEDVETGWNYINISTGKSPSEPTGGSPDDRAICSVAMKTMIGYGEPAFTSEGCNWTVEFYDNTFATIPVPTDYTGGMLCNYTNSSIYYDNSSAVQDAAFRLFSQLDIMPRDGRLDMKLNPDSVVADARVVGGVRSLWGPVRIKLIVWK
ncbi:MAG: hypothetical protein DRO95_05505 [Candidatus Altiarchaeales archaeon]|nr:MAG: hypothetical protein DRO95_05505 [Candidatus Altiarchaeales archaeon]